MSIIQSAEHPNPLARQGVANLWAHTVRARAFPWWQGVGMALLVIVGWGGTLAFLLTRDLVAQPLWALGAVVQTHLFTGLFITSHDGMHGSLAPGKPRLNHALGALCAALFAFNPYKRLRAEHYRHHAHAATGHDPDYHPGAPLQWYLRFLGTYVTWRQIVAVALLYNVFVYLLKVPHPNMVVFYVVPSFLSTFQLFYFGTYLPHHGNHDEASIHRARSANTNHFRAFVSCYFFGYHEEHHVSPGTPWWQLPAAVDAKSRPTHPSPPIRHPNAHCIPKPHPHPIHKWGAHASDT